MRDRVHIWNVRERVGIGLMGKHFQFYSVIRRFEEDDATRVLALIKYAIRSA